MSRHDLEGGASNIIATLGWDNPAGTFSAEVRETLPNGNFRTIEIGEEPGEFETPEELAAALESYADLDAATLLALAEDRDFESKATHPVSPDQFVMPFDQPDVEKEAPVMEPEQAARETAIHLDKMEAAKPERPGAIEGLQALWGSAIDTVLNAADKLRDFWGSAKDTASDVGAFGKEFGKDLAVNAASGIGKAMVVEAGEVIGGGRNAWDQFTNHGQDQLPRHFSPHAVTNEPGIHGSVDASKGPETPASPGGSDLYGPEPHSLDERLAVSNAYGHAENAPGIRAEMDAAEGTPYSHTGAPDYENRGSIYGASDTGAPMSPADRASLYGYEPEITPEQSQEQAIQPQGPDR